MYFNRIKRAVAYTQLALTAAAGPAFAATEKVYVADEGADTVSVIDATSFKKIGASPQGLRITPDGKQVWVANLKGGTVSVIDTTSLEQVATIAVGKGPAQVAFTPDGRFGFVSLSEDNQVALIDPASRIVIRKLDVGAVPIQLYATPESRLVLVANQGTPKKPGTTVSVIDVAGLKVAATIKTGAGAHGVVIDRDGRRAFVSNTYARTPCRSSTSPNARSSPRCRWARAPTASAWRRDGACHNL